MDQVIKNLNMEDSLQRLGNYLATPKFWVSVIILVAAVVAWQVLKRIRKKWKEKNGGFTTASNTVFDIARFVFLFIVFVVLLQINGINVTALLTGLGVVSAIVGLALQDFFKDIIMGIHILIDKFYNVGDVIRYNNMEGVVISFNVRTTKIELTQYHEIVTISNRNISEITVLGDMFDLDIDLPYYVDARRIHQVMQELTEEIGKIEGIKKTQYKGTNSFNDSSVTYRIRYWTNPDGSRFDKKREANMIVQNRLNAEGIPFAYNHLDVTLMQEK